MVSETPKPKYAIGDSVMFIHKRIRGKIFNSTYLYHMDEHSYLVQDAECVLHEVRELYLVPDEGQPSLDCSAKEQIT
jgi:hypothetical protein